MLHFEKIFTYNIFILSIAILTAAIPYSPNTKNIEHPKGSETVGTYLGLIFLFSFLYIALLDFYFPGTGTFLANLIAPYLFAFCKWFILTYIYLLKQSVTYTFVLANWLYSTFLWLEPWRGMDHTVFFVFFLYGPWAVRTVWYTYYPTLEQFLLYKKIAKESRWKDPVVQEMAAWGVFYLIWDYIFTSIF